LSSKRARLWRNSVFDIGFRVRLKPRYRTELAGLRSMAIPGVPARAAAPSSERPFGSSTVSIAPCFMAAIAAASSAKME
jgi:hypothetical protein